MTILDQITREVKALPSKQRQEALRLIRSLKIRSKRRTKSRSPTKISGTTRAKLHPALRAIAGMWKDRTDLPKDGAAASVVLRRRLMGRDPNA
jgi:hypothetical protein